MQHGELNLAHIAVSFFVATFIIVFVRHLWLRLGLLEKLSKQLENCTTHKEAGLIAENAGREDFPTLWVNALGKEKALFAEFLRVREEQFQKDLESAGGSEEKLLALLGEVLKNEHMDPHFGSHARMSIRVKLRPFTERSILEATQLEDLLSLSGFIPRNGMIICGGFVRIDETLKGLYSQKAKQLACSEAISSRCSRDACFVVKTGDEFIDALVAMKKEVIVLSYESPYPSFDLTELHRAIDSTLGKANQ